MFFLRVDQSSKVARGNQQGSAAVANHGVHAIPKPRNFNGQRVLNRHVNGRESESLGGYGFYLHPAKAWWGHNEGFPKRQSPTYLPCRFPMVWLGSILSFELPRNSSTTPQTLDGPQTHMCP
jgi:hypothetical protein